MDDKFYYNAEYQVLFCREHQQGVKGLERHLKDAHGLRKKKERQPILDVYQSVVMLPPKDVRQPPDNCTTFDVLGKPLQGFKCIDCGDISINYKTMSGHCNIEHLWYVTRDD